MALHKLVLAGRSLQFKPSNMRKKLTKESFVIFGSWNQLPGSKIKYGSKSDGYDGTHKANDIVWHTEIRCWEGNQK